MSVSIIEQASDAEHKLHHNNNVNLNRDPNTESDRNPNHNSNIDIYRLHDVCILLRVSVPIS